MRKRSWLKAFRYRKLINLHQNTKAPIETVVEWTGQERLCCEHKATRLESRNPRLSLEKIGQRSRCSCMLPSLSVALCVITSFTDNMSLVSYKNTKKGNFGCRLPTNEESVVSKGWRVIIPLIIMHFLLLLIVSELVDIRYTYLYADCHLKDIICVLGIDEFDILVSSTLFFQVSGI